ncbi:VanZ family protein [Paenibacillus stellifer]|uniref:VanZ family protein n=1 Tax=Paenibacillus stellifer TaxID=169760 RepID=UPI000B28F568|nr:VanZ family protein [Paenibacillus stellifer]
MITNKHRSRLTQERRDRPERSVAAAVCLVLYAACLIYWMFFGFGRSVHLAMDEPLSYNLVPFNTIRLYLRAAAWLPPQIVAVNLLGNVAVFVPLGMLLPPSCRMRSLLELLLWFIPGIFLVEILQMLLRAGSFDVDDIILNGLGVWIGYGLLRLCSRFFRKSG